MGVCSTIETKQMISPINDLKFNNGTIYIECRMGSKGMIGERGQQTSLIAFKVSQNFCRHNRDLSVTTFWQVNFVSVIVSMKI